MAQRVAAMIGRLDTLQLRPEIDGLLRRLVDRGLALGATGCPWCRLERAGIADLFAADPAAPAVTESRPPDGGRTRPLARPR